MVSFKVGNDKKIHLWHDNWHPNSPLLLTYGYRTLYDSEIPANSRLSTMSKGTEWDWPPARSENLVEIQVLICDYFSKL